MFSMTQSGLTLQNIEIFWKMDGSERLVAAQDDDVGVDAHAEQLFDRSAAWASI